MRNLAGGAEVQQPAADSRQVALSIQRSALSTQHWILGAALVGGAALRVIGLSRQSFWTDELYVVWEGRQPLGAIFDPHIHIQHPPGYRLALHAWMGLGQSETWIRLLPALAGVLLIAVAWALARAWWPAHPAAAGAAAVGTATAPFLLHYSQDATTYSWTTLWLAGSMWLLLRAWRTDRAGWWAAWAASLAGTLYSHYFSIFPLVVEGLAVGGAGFLAWRRQVAGTGRRLIHAGVAVLAAIALYLPWLGILFTQGRDVLGTPLFPLSVDTQILGWLPVLLAGYANGPLWQERPGTIIAWAVVGVAGAWGLWRLMRGRGWRHGPSLALLAGWGAAAFLGPYLFLRLTTPPEAADPVRFAAMAAPALLLAGAAVFATLPRRGQVLVAILWLGLAAYQWQAEVRAPAKQDWRGVLGTIAAQGRPGDAWLAFPAFHAGAAAAYYPVPVPLSGGWFTGGGSDPTGAAYWFPPGWHWRAWFDPHADRSADWAGQLASHVGGATRLWYLAGDGVDGTYPPSPAAERALKAAGWQPTQEWHTSPLVLRLYVRAVR